MGCNAQIKFVLSLFYYHQLIPNILPGVECFTGTCYIYATYHHVTMHIHLNRFAYSVPFPVERIKLIWPVESNVGNSVFISNNMDDMQFFCKANR